MPLVTLPDQDWIDAVGAVEGAQLLPWDVLADHPRGGDIEVVVPPYMGSQARLSRLASLPDLRLVQLLSAGYEEVVAHIPPGARLANAAGVHDASTAELAVGLALAALRGIPEFVRSQQQGRWASLPMRTSLADRRVLLVGYGSIGRAVARRLEPFEVSLTAVASRARAGDELVDRVHAVSDLPRLLPAHDLVVVVVPLTPATTSLVDAAFLAAMPDGALLVNVARGKVLNTDALVAEQGRIHAALDVTDPEPLPDGHPLWSTPHVLISPHVGGATSAFQPRAVRMLRAQLARYVAGEDLVNVVHVG